MSVRSRPWHPLVVLIYPIPYRKGVPIKIAELAAILVKIIATVARTQVNVLQAGLAALSFAQILQHNKAVHIVFTKPDICQRYAVQGTQGRCDAQVMS